MNLVYSILLRGVDHHSSYFQRRVDTAVKTGHAAEVGALLVEQAMPGAVQNYQAEQLVQVCLRSALAGRLAELDPASDYGNVFTMPGISTEVASGQPGVAVSLLEPDYRHSWVEEAHNLRVDVAGNRVYLDAGPAMPLDAVGGLSAPIAVAEGVQARITGLYPAPEFNLRLRMVRWPARSVPDLLAGLRQLPMDWRAEYQDYQATPDINDWLAAVVLNYCEGAADGS